MGDQQCFYHRPPNMRLVAINWLPRHGQPQYKGNVNKVKGMSLSPTWNARSSAFQLASITSSIRPLASMLQWRFNNHPNGMVRNCLLHWSDRLLLTSINLLKMQWWRIWGWTCGLLAGVLTSIVAIALATCKMETHRIRIFHKIIDH